MIFAAIWRHSVIDGVSLDGREEMHTSLVLLRDDALALRDLLNQIFPSQKPN